jgi:hypothetical protein
MKLADWDGKGDCWIFRGDEDDLFEFVPFCDTPSVCVDSDASSDDEAEFEGDLEEMDADEEVDGSEDNSDAAQNEATEYTAPAADIYGNWCRKGKLHDLQLLCEDEAHTVREYCTGYTGGGSHASRCHTCEGIIREMYWIQFDDGRTDSLDECYCWQCTLDSLQANQEAATLSAAPNCGLSESDDDDAEEEGTASGAPSVHEDSDASSDGEETETGEGDSDESDAADSSDAFLGASCECEARGRRKSHDCSMDYSQ